MGKEIKILIVEDEVITSLYLKSLLEKNQYTVTGTASTGMDAVNAALNKRPDVILMDVGLSGEMTGIEAADIIRKSYNPVLIFMTGYQDAEVIESIEKLKNSHVVIKPIKTFQLEEILNQFRDN